MRNRNVWTRCVGKRPVMVSGAPASSTDPATWDAFDAVQGGAGDGFGIMLGGGLGCYDLDHVSDAQARDLIAAIPERVLYVERSVSGEGFHVFVDADEAPGWKHAPVERYSRERFIRVTLDRVRVSHLGTASRDEYVS